MNYSTAILIMNEQCRAIHVTYEDSEHAPRSTVKTFDKNIAVGDYVIVPTETRHNMTVCKVVEVDVDDWMDIGTTVPWVLGRIDLANAKELQAQEEQAITALKTAEKLRKRRELKASMEAALQEGGGSLKSLPIATMGAEETPHPPPPPAPRVPGEKEEAF